MNAWPARLLPLTLICAAHAGLAWWVMSAISQPMPVKVEPPAVVGRLVPPPPPSTEPVPLPVAPKPAPTPPKPRPAPPPPKAPPPPPKAPPSERAVSAPEPQPAVPVDTVAVAPAPAPAAPAPAPAAEPKDDAPVVPPRSDASHLSNPAPVYPESSRRLGEEGRVLFDVYILPDGSVGEIKLKRSSGFARLDQAAQQAVRKWRYQPARRGNEAIAYWYVQPLQFSLDG